MYRTKHDQIAEKLARKLKTDYKSDKGIDLVTTKRVIEVETKRGCLKQGMDQIVHSPKARYLAVSDATIKAALELTKKTGIGIMNEKGKVIKRAGRR